MYTVTLGDNTTFECEKGDSILESSLKNKILVEHSCYNGQCKSCIAKLKHGKIKTIIEETVLSKKEKKEGYILTCISTPISDINLEIQAIDFKYHIPKRIIPAKINSLQYLSKDLLKLTLRLPPNSTFKYHNGQFINIIYKEITRSYSVANACNVPSNLLEFYIRNYKGGEMSEYLFNSAKVNDLLRIEGPFGTFYLKDGMDSKKIIFLATGTGLAPIKSIIEGLNEAQVNFKNIIVFHGVRKPRDLFWQPSAPINYVPVLSQPDSDWTGESGYIQDVLINQKIDLKQYNVFACGSMEMIKSSEKILIENGLGKSCFFSDAFVKSK